MTMTIQTVKSGNASLFNVYPLIVGEGGKDQDHSPAIKIILDDIKAMNCVSNPTNQVVMWNGKTKRNEKISVHLICVVQDQPERRKCNALLLGGKGSHPRFGWNMKVRNFIDQLPPCTDCRKDLETIGEWKAKKCSKCLCWMSDVSQVLQPVPDTYPKSKSGLIGT
jgi:hypothetical protein